MGCADIYHIDIGIGKDFFIRAVRFDIVQAAVLDAPVGGSGCGTESRDELLGGWDGAGTDSCDGVVDR